MIDAFFFLPFLFFFFFLFYSSSVRVSPWILEFTWTGIQPCIPIRYSGTVVGHERVCVCMCVCVYVRAYVQSDITRIIVTKAVHSIPWLEQESTINKRYRFKSIFLFFSFFFKRKTLDYWNHFFFLTDSIEMKGIQRNPVRLFLCFQSRYTPCVESLSIEIIVHSTSLIT